jgi:hypothetical protein
MNAISTVLSSLKSTGLVDTLLVDVAEDVGRKRDDRLVRLFGALLPPAELFAGLVSIFVRHVKIAL